MTCSPSYCVATEALANVAKHGAGLSLLADPQRDDHHAREDEQRAACDHDDVDQHGRQVKRAVRGGRLGDRLAAVRIGGIGETPTPL